MAKAKEVNKTNSLLETKESKLVLSAIEEGLQETSVWNQTGAIINQSRLEFEGKKTAEMSKAFSGLLNKNTDPSLVPEEGLDRKGDYISRPPRGGVD